MKIKRMLSALSVTCLLVACGSNPTASTDPTVVETTEAPSTTLGTTTVPVVTETPAPEAELFQLPGAGSPGVDLVLGEWGSARETMDHVDEVPGVPGPTGSDHSRASSLSAVGILKNDQGAGRRPVCKPLTSTF